MSAFQTYIGSAFASYPVRWVESPETARSAFAKESAAQPVEGPRDPDENKPKSASGDVLDISPQYQQEQLHRVLEANAADSRIETEKADAKAADTKTTEKTADGKESELKAEESEQKSEQSGKSAASPEGKELTPEEEQQVAELKARDQEVRIHEQAHVAAGGAYVTGGPSFTFQTGPDGKKYAIGGEVGIDTGTVSGDPQATIQKMRTVAAAALAPAEPSGQDQKVAAAARQAIAKAQMELAQQNAEKMTGSGEESAEGGLQTENSAKSGESASAVQAGSQSGSQTGSPAKSDTKSETSSAVKTFAAGAASAASASAYKAQSSMSLSAPRFTAFA